MASVYDDLGQFMVRTIAVAAQLGLLSCQGYAGDGLLLGADSDVSDDFHAGGSLLTDYLCIYMLMYIHYSSITM